ncbi:A circularly permuted ATPgrasp family protein [Rhodoferax koreense]|uniref:A circularly permuted ATPgrasp family protein n=1 Tax=Rhodoferax koreensis TaxID=1842727 RepID=A0A1P8JVA7_9BURK|nr:circularly permuted type 2 ATP-grasp protein [Rhodoferax koreense]APW37611.1 A circularly permuted ATPgrasp family protein [Rhodoferax koreense]
MEKQNNSLFEAQAQESASGLASVLARAALPGHFDELRGQARPADDGPLRSAASQAPPTPEWSEFFEHLGREGFNDLNRRTAQLQRQIRDNGVTYNLYADADNPQRPWSLDLFPLIVSPESWQQVEAGVLQRVRVLDSVMADMYGPQQLLARGLLPPALVQGHPGYLRSMHGVQPIGGTHLHIAAFDLARGPDGNWWVVSQRTQAPSGLGYLLENRLSISRLFPQAFEAMHIQRLAATYRALIEGLKQMSPAGKDSHIALLTPGPYNETYFEHAYLARYLGLTLVEGSDLTVRDQHLYLKTLKGLEPVHGLLKRLDDQYLDPLELRPDSRLGVPGLLQVIRAGNVLVANAPGSAFLESPALLGFLPALSRHLLGEELQLPALPTWWCGERAALESALPDLANCVIKPTYRGTAGHNAFEAVLGRNLSRRELDEWAGRIVRQGDEYTVQAYLPLSQMPTWTNHPNHPPRIAPRSMMLRVFAVSDGPRSWRVLPGGLARMVSMHDSIASMQRGGSSADAWVKTKGEVDRTTLLTPRISPDTLTQRKRMVTSRAAENLFWLGRYAERTENSIRLARVILEGLNGDDQSSAPLLSWMRNMAIYNGLVLPAVPSAVQARRVFERSLIAGLGNASEVPSVGYNLRSIRHSGSALRERLSKEHWNVIVRAEEEFFDRCAENTKDGDFSPLEALRLLEDTSTHMAAMTGAQTDRMTRDDGWRLLSIGRHIERLGFLSSALLRGFQAGSMASTGGFEAMISLFDSSITFHAQYQQSRDITALIDLLVLDRDNPRALGWVAHTLRGRLAKLAGSAPTELSPLALTVVNPSAWDLHEISQPDAEGRYSALEELLDQTSDCAYNISDEIGSVYFTHSRDLKQSVGA